MLIRCFILIYTVIATLLMIWLIEPKILSLRYCI